MTRTALSAKLRVSKYDRLHPWTSVQDAILEILRARGSYPPPISIPKGIQLMETVRHPHAMNSILYVKGTTNDVFVTQVSKGASHQISVWLLAKGTRQLKTIRFQVDHKFVEMIFIPCHRIFIAYCSDMHLRVYADFNNGFIELSTTPCPTVLLSLAYDKEMDQLITGGIGILAVWSLTQYREELVKVEPYTIELTREQWVTKLRMDSKNRLLMVQTDDEIFILNCKSGSIEHIFPNRHSLSLSCTAVHPARDYFITAAKDGSIKVWNSIVFSLMHEFTGHLKHVTGLIAHPVEPLLLSCSMDGTLRMWRLDTFEMYQRIDIGDKILGMQLLNNQELALWSETEIRFYRLNMYVTLYTPIQSSVHKLMRVKCNGRPSRIVVSAEDGGVRFVSPVSGETITIVYPMASFRVLTDLAYDRYRNKLFAVMQDGNVIVFDCTTNPCQPKYKLSAGGGDQAILCLCLHQLYNHVDKTDSSPSDVITFVGRRDGMISVLESPKYQLRAPVQAHQGEVTELVTSHGVRRHGDPTIGLLDRLVSMATDAVIKIWEVEVATVEGQLALVPLKKINCDGTPNTVSMYSNILAYSIIDKGALHMLRLSDEPDGGRNLGLKAFTHDTEADHTQQINGLDCCPAQGIFISVGDDGYLKVWDSNNDLIREIHLDESLHGVCFANDRGDILLGYQKHLYVVRLQSYLPLDSLERTVLKDFQDEKKEAPFEFSHNLQLWFDYSKLLVYPAHVGPQEEVKQEPSESSYHSHLEDAIKKKRYSLSKERRQSFKPGTPTELKTPQRSKEKTQVQFSGESGEELTVVVSSDTQTALEMDDNKENVENQPVDELAPEKKVESKPAKKVKKFWPIAPDGYIPNSIIRQKLGFKPKPDDRLTRKVEPWKLKPVPGMDTTGTFASASTSEDFSRDVSDTSMVPFTFIDESDEAIEVTGTSSDEVTSPVSQAPRATTSALKKRLKSRPPLAKVDLGTDAFGMGKGKRGKKTPRGKRLSIMEGEGGLGALSYHVGEGEGEDAAFSYHRVCL